MFEGALSATVDEETKLGRTLWTHPRPGPGLLDRLWRPSVAQSAWSFGGWLEGRWPRWLSERRPAT